jgi:hypothetical protein
MALSVAEISLVSPLGSSPSEHVFFARAEVTPHASGAFTTREGESLPINDCAWIPASRPWGARLRLLAKQALARVGPASPKTPIVVIAPREAVSGDAELLRFLALAGHTVVSARSGSAAFVSALHEARELLAKEPEVIVLAVDSLLSQREVTAWAEVRYSAFTRNPLPPSEGAAAVRLVQASRGPLAGKIHAFAGAQSEATDDNDVPPDGVALGRVFAELGLPATVPLLVGPWDVDPLRTREYHLVAARNHARIDRAENPSFEGRIGLFGSAAGLMSTVLALAWLRHGLPLPEAGARRVALSWGRSRDGAVGAALVGDERS